MGRAGAVQTAAKIVDGILTYAKLASAAIATSAEVLAGTASKLVPASILTNYGKVSILTQSSATTIPNTAWTPVAFNTEASDELTGHDNVTNNTRFQPNTAMRVAAKATVQFASTGNGLYSVAIYKNGVVISGGLQYLSLASGVPNVLSVSALGIDLNGTTDYIEVYAFVNIGSSTTTVAAQTVLEVMRVR